MSATTADAIVIGAGILGAAAAHNLASAGLRVVVLERGAPNREGSGTTAGNLHIQAIHPSRPGQKVPADIKRFLPLQIAASGLWESIEAELDESVELRRGGGLMVAETPEQVAELESKNQLERSFGLDTELVDGDTARRMLPQLAPSIARANWCRHDGYANPLLITPAFLRSASRQGARILAYSPVESIATTRAGTYVVTHRGGVVEAPVVINAAGSHFGIVSAMAGISLDTSPVAIQMHITTRIPPLMTMLVQHVSEGLSVKQVSSGQMLIGGGWPAAATDLDARSPVSVASIIGNLRQAQRILPFLKDLKLLRAWAGPLAAVPDELPVVGEVAGHPGFIVMGGTYAFTLAPLWGRTALQLATGQAPAVDISDLTPSRLLRSSGAALSTGLNT